MLTRRFRRFFTCLLIVAAFLVYTQFFHDMVTKDINAYFSDKLSYGFDFRAISSIHTLIQYVPGIYDTQIPRANETQNKVPRTYELYANKYMPRTSETHSIDSRTYTRMKFGPVFILGVVGGNSSANSSWDHFRIYGMLDRKVYKRKKLSCCLLYRGINGFVTVKTDTMRQRFHEVPAAMWNFHVSCSNVKSAQGHIPAGLAVTLRNNGRCSKSHVIYVPPHFPAHEPQKIVIGSKLAYGSIEAEQIIEWVEAMRYIGVNKIVTYFLSSLNTDAMNVLRHYASDGFVDLYFYDPANEETYPRVDNFKTRVAQSWNDQTAVVYDSFERYSECRYFAVIDQDEFFIPGKYRTLGEMFDHLEQEYTDATGFVIRSQYYYRSWGKRLNASGTILGSYTTRENREPRFDRRKNFVKPARAALAGTHTHYVWPAEGFKMYPLPAEEGFIRHFRHDCRPHNYVKCMTNTSRVEDTTVAEWSKGFRDQVARVRKMILGL